MKTKITQILFLKFVAIAAMAQFISGCVSGNNDAAPIPPATLVGPPKPVSNFIPIDPVPVPFTFIAGEDGKPKKKAWASFSTVEKYNRLAVNTDPKISVAQDDGQGNLSFLTSSLSAANSNYLVTIDNCAYTDENVTDENNIPIGSGRVGVGIRIKASVHTLSANVDLGDLFLIGVAAQSNKVQGTMTVEVFGVDNADIVNLFVTTSTIDTTSIEKTMESVAAIFSKLSNPKTILTPELIAIMPVGASATPEKIKKVKILMQKQ